MTSTAVRTMAPETFEIPCKDGLTLRGDVYHARNAAGAVIVCHGFKGFGRWAFFPHLSRALADSGLTAITFDFSGSGIGRDRENFTEPDAFAHNTFSRDVDDIELVEDHARRMKWIQGKFGLFGHSRGGGVAILYTAVEAPNRNSPVPWGAISHPNRGTPKNGPSRRRRGVSEGAHSRNGQGRR